MNVDTERFILFFDEEELGRCREVYGREGDGYGATWEIKTGVRDLLTGDESSFETVIYDFNKDLSLNDKFKD